LCYFVKTFSSTSSRITKSKHLILSAYDTPNGESSSAAVYSLNCKGPLISFKKIGCTSRHCRFHMCNKHHPIITFKACNLSFISNNFHISASFHLVLSALNSSLLLHMYQNILAHPLHFYHF